jgi:hypothetical protein
MRSALVIHAGQAADLANMFSRSYRGDPKALTKEAIEQVQRAVRAWTMLASKLGVTE